MLNIPQAIKKGQYGKNEDGTYTVYGVVKLRTYDKATEDDVRAKHAHIVGACINHRIEEKKVSAVISTLEPKVKNWDVIDTPTGRIEIQNIQEDGSCELHPLDGQSLGLPHTATNWTFGNIYQIPSVAYEVLLQSE